MDDDAITAFWQQYLAALPAEATRPRAFSAWSFGDSPAMADELGDLVRRGIKTATASLGWVYAAEGTALPKPGDLSIILDGARRPLCLIETTEVRVLPFETVDAQFAFDEGEDDRSLESWRAGHWRYFGRACVALGREPTQTMPVVCERFRLLFAPTTKR